MDSINAAIKWFSDLYNGHGWMLQVFIVVFITLLLQLTESIFYHRLYKKMLKTKNFWDDTLIESLHKPFGFLIWLLGLTFAADIAGTASKHKEIFSAVDPIRDLGILLLLVWFIIRLIKRGEENILLHPRSKKRADKTTVNAVSQLLIVTTIITAVLIGMQMFGIPISGVLAFGGIGGVAVAFAAKDLLANFFGGMLVYLDRPFKVGDWINSPDKQIEGTVEQIGWRLTRIRAFDKRPVYVPNSIFSTIVVKNPSRMSHRRINTNIGIRYQDANKMEVIVNDVKKMLSEHPEIDNTQTLIVNFVEFGPSSLNFMIYAFTKTVNWITFQEIQQDVFLKIINIIESHGAECAFPTQTLHIADPIHLTGSKEHEIA